VHDGLRTRVVQVCIQVAVLILSHTTPTEGRDAVTRVTLSGQSAGGSMAMQHLFAYSSAVDGAAIAAGSPYGCGELPKRMVACYTGPVDVARVSSYARWQEARGAIDGLSNLDNKPILLFNGRNDFTVFTAVMQASAEQLETFVHRRQVKRRFGTGAAHVWSLNHGACSCGACLYSIASSAECCDVNNCDYELTAEMFERFYADVNPPQAASQPLWWFDQLAHLPQTSNETWVSHGLWRWGFAYVPESCVGAIRRCRIHVHYHGCINKKWSQRHLWSRSLDIDNFAESNGVIVVYPQAAGDKHTGVGCWNWLSSKSDPHYDTQLSVQLRTVSRILQNLDSVLDAATQVLENSTYAWYSAAEDATFVV